MIFNYLFAELEPVFNKFHSQRLISFFLCVCFAAVRMEETLKLCLLGEGSVGKTSILLQYIENKFDETHQPTIQVTPITFRLRKANTLGVTTLFVVAIRLTSFPSLALVPVFF